MSQVDEESSQQCNGRNEEWDHIAGVNTILNSTGIIDPDNDATASVNDDDDEDNWSRQVETDEIQRMPSSITGDMNTIDGEDGEPGDVIPPRREEPTLKERLVERERQRRAETERARWKRQFALAAHTEADDEDNNNHTGDERIGEEINGSANGFGVGARETNSVAGTIGEDTVAPIEMLEDEHTKMNYPMERFLKEQETSIQQEGASDLPKKENSRDSVLNQGVVMERFLQEPPVVVMDNMNASDGTMLSPTSVQRSVSFDTDSRPNAEILTALPRDVLNTSAASSSIADASTERLPSTQGELDTQENSASRFDTLPSANGSIANVSTICLPPSEDDHEPNEVPLEVPSGQREARNALDRPGEPVVVLNGSEDLDQSESPSQHRVVLRLTEAEIQEMAAIDEASRSNAPPSERDDMSELGELVSDFGGPVHLDHPNLSQGTPTTAMESASSVANQSGMVEMNMSASDHAGDDQLSIGGTDAGSVSTHVDGSSAGGDVSLAANPPSETGREEDVRNANEHIDVQNISVPNEVVPMTPPRPDKESFPTSSEGNVPLPALSESLDMLGEVQHDETIVNRTIRPGMHKYKERDGTDEELAPVITEHIDGFDFDKDELKSPFSPSADGSNEILVRNELWSAGLSPMRANEASDPPSLPAFPDYGTREGTESDSEAETRRFGSGRGSNTAKYNVVGAGTEGEHRRLLEAVPGEVSTGHRRGSNFTSLTSIRSLDDVHSIAESVFSDIRSESTGTANIISAEAQDYLNSSTLKRAFPERLFALTVTLLLEIPVLLMVSGGSDRLCYLIGRTKYQLLVGFLPLSSAISGNVGLQSSTLTTRAISHGQVKVGNYTNWLIKEIGAALYLGLGMGGFLGIIAYVASGYSLSFGLTVMIAQFISILTAGCTGTFAPLLFTFIFERDSGKWGGPLETAVQDIVGSFAMVIISYRILVWFGPYDVAENDVCGSEDLQ